MRALFADLLLLISAGLAQAADIQRVPRAFTYMGAPQSLPNGGRPLAKTPFPRIRDWNSLRITLDRGVCMGDCPAYHVEIRGNGEVRFEGYDHVLLSRAHTARIPPAAARALFARFREADFFRLYDKYESGITDWSEYTLSISYDEHSKSVLDYVGVQVGMPKSVAALENAVDEAAGTDRWIGGGPDPIARLKAEGWNFRATDDDHTALLQTAAEAGRDDVIRGLLAAGVPAGNRMGCIGAEYAAIRGDTESFKQLSEAGAPLYWPGAKDQEGCEVLVLAADCASPEILRLTLERHPDLIFKDDEPALDRLAEVAKDYGDGKPHDYAACGRLLIAAGADVNGRFGNRTALMNASDAGLLRVLLAAGARGVNEQDWRGQTTLFNARTPEALTVLLEASADPAIRDRDGRTALDAAIFSGDKEKAAFLKDWAAKHAPPLH